MPAVDFVTNCWERDYRRMLSPEYVADKANGFVYPFRKRVVLVNNVNDLEDAKAMAQNALRRGDVDEVVFVSDALPKALAICGLKNKDLGKVHHFIDFLLVGVTCTNADYIFYCDSDVEMERAEDWISPALAKLNSNKQFFIANPCWSSDRDGAQREAITTEESYYIGYGFSDQCFLAKRESLASPIYGERHPAGQRYPLSKLGDTFEKRVDAFMRNNGLLRLTDSRIAYHHIGEEGTFYPAVPLWKRIDNKIRWYITRK